MAQLAPLVMFQPAMAMLEPIAAAPEPELAFIGPLSDRRQARLWALVLQSQGIAFVLHAEQGGHVLQVSADDNARALEAIAIYEKENRNWPPPRRKDNPRHPASLAVPFAFLALMLFFVYVTGPARLNSTWFEHGRADALLLASEPWRMFTALTLHADVGHVLGNTLSGGIFGVLLSRRLGPGGALLGMLLAGALGNTLNALHHLPGGHRSIGASTAVFAAIGLLAAVQTVLLVGRRKGGEHHKMRVVDVIAPIVGGLTLLGSLGAGGGNTDVWAHGFGFLAGAVIGTGAALVVRRAASRPSTAFQVVAMISALVLLGGSWALALGL